VTLISNLEYDRMRVERDEARAIARRLAFWLTKQNSGEWILADPPVTQLLREFDALPWAKNRA
jgi:hypothetical protein